MKEHPSFTRLMKVARAATAGTDRAITSQAALARHMNESDQTIYNWKTREGGVSLEGAIKAEQLYSTSATYILEGIQIPSDSVKSPSLEVGMAQATSPAERIVEQPELPTLIRRGTNVDAKDLPERFRMLVDDEAMAPKIAEGTWVVFEKAGTAIPGKRVLVRTRLGNLYFRRYQEPDEAGRWKAVPDDDKNYQTYDSVEHGLEIVARVLHIERPDDD